MGRERLLSTAFRVHAFFMLPDEEPGPEQIRALRKIPGEKRLRLAEQLYWSARKLKLAGLRSQHPTWTEEQLTSELRNIFLNART